MPLASIEQTRRFAASGKARIQCHRRLDCTIWRSSSPGRDGGRQSHHHRKKKGSTETVSDTRRSLDGVARVGLGELQCRLYVWLALVREGVELQIQAGQLGNMLAILLAYNNADEERMGDSSRYLTGEGPFGSES